MRREQSAKELIINDYNHKVSKRNRLMINDYSAGNTRRNKRCYSPKLAVAKADYLCRKLKSPQSRNFYLKCAWNLTDMFIDNLLMIALKKEVPAKYFAFVAAKEMQA